MTDRVEVPVAERALLRIPEAAALCGVSRRTFDRYLAAGLVHSVRVRGLRLIPRAALDQLGEQPRNERRKS